MKARTATLIMAALLALYLVCVTNYAVLLIVSPGPAAQILGYALIVLPPLGAGLLIAELMFVIRGQRLLAQLQREGGLPLDALPRLPSGRADPAVADAHFPAYRAEVEAHPESWQVWMRLGLAYDACGDRRRARWAARRAIMLSRSATRQK
ncbi:MAG: hypothetical protein ACRCSP_02145 [Rhodoglobus sp.]